tara:strand:+ start:431 stop:967 length:537 start_codon:yes stop_codon:yes gene_type:complete
METLDARRPMPDARCPTSDAHVSAESASSVFPTLCDDLWEEILATTGPLDFFSKADRTTASRRERCAARRLQRWMRRVLSLAIAYRVGERVLVRVDATVQTWAEGELSRLPYLGDDACESEENQMWVVTFRSSTRAASTADYFSGSDTYERSRPVYYFFRRGQKSVMTLRRAPTRATV